MDSKLDSIFRTRFHPAEKTDSWMGIRRQDPADDRQKRDRKEQDQSGEFGDDNTTLSVTALHGFLRSLLPQEGGKRSAVAEESLPDAAAPPGDSRPGHRAAAGAYQSASRAGAGSQLNLTDTPVAAGPALPLNAEELRIIRALVRDVETLARRGVQTITLYTAADFLHSLAIGIEDALETSLEP